MAVVPNVLTPQECDDHVSQLRVWLKKFPDNGMPDSYGSIIHKYKVAHHPVAWSVRLRVAPVFESLWDTKKVVTSFDGMAIGQPPEIGHEKFAEFSPSNLHLDQGGTKEGLHAYQGAVYLEAADEDDWCFVVMNGSHKQHADFFTNRTKKPPRTEFLKLTQQEIKWYEGLGCPVRRVPVPKGGMVLWDSRTVHAGAPPSMHRKNPERWRFVLFICMAPAIWASPKDMAKKKGAYHKMNCSRHWPAQGFSTFANKPTPPQLDAVSRLPVEAQTKKARYLAGDLEYDFDDGEPNGPPTPRDRSREGGPEDQNQPLLEDPHTSQRGKKRRKYACPTF